MRRVIVAVVVALAAVWPATGAGADVRRINAPRLTDPVPYAEAAVAWFGRVEPGRNATDIRVAYTATEVWVSLNIFDQWLWEDDAATRTPASLEQWDAATLLIDTRSTPGSTPSAQSYRFVGALNWWRPRTDYQAAYVGNGTGWTLAPSIAFTTEAGWRGDAPNTTVADRGWVMTYHIPYASLGLSGPPAAGTTWGVGFQIHDKDSAAVAATLDSVWPETLVREQPGTWGQLGFGARVYASGVAPGAPLQTYTIRHRLNGVIAPDAMVGGGTNCGGADYFNLWGGLNYAGDTTLNIQNQSDVADWPCFSKAYVEFPLALVPAGKRIVSATLTMYQFGGSDPTQAQRSLIQVLTVGEPFSESTVTWNTAPLALENVSASWADPLPVGGVPWPGAPRTWDVSWALWRAYSGAQPSIRFALYEADSAYHSGKYFVSADTGDWNAAGRPTLQIVVTDDVGIPAAPTNVRILR